MKIKKLKKILIGDTIFKIKWDPNTSGGSFNYSKKLITIGTKPGNIHALAVLIHEFKEIIQVEQTTRLDRHDCDSEYIFVYNHAQHTDLCSRLAGLLSQFII